MTAGRLQILIVDDEHLIREALRLLLESTLACDVAEADSARAACDAVRASRPDLVLLDVTMPGEDGLWALRELHLIDATLPVLMLSSQRQPRTVRAALEAGARGYVLKTASSEQFAEAIRTARSGEGVYVHPLVAEGLVTEVEDGTDESLTDRERAVLDRLVAGATNEEIAGALFVSDRTVKSHLSTIFRKLGVTNRTQAVAKALRLGLVDPDIPG